MSQGQRVLSSLSNGSTLTAKQIAARFGIANPTAVITRLRRQGANILSVKRTNSKNESRTFYSI